MYTQKLTDVTFASYWKNNDATIRNGIRTVTFKLTEFLHIRITNSLNHWLCYMAMLTVLDKLLTTILTKHSPCHYHSLTFFVELDRHCHITMPYKNHRWYNNKTLDIPFQDNYCYQKASGYPIILSYYLLIDLVPQKALRNCTYLIPTPKNQLYKWNDMNSNFQISNRQPWRLDHRVCWL